MNIYATKYLQLLKKCSKLVPMHTSYDFGKALFVFVTRTGYQYTILSISVYTSPFCFSEINITPRPYRSFNMAKRSLEFISDGSISAKLSKEIPPLSPSKITSTEEHATISGMLAALSPVKPSRYFDAELTDGHSVIRLVGFDKAKRQELQSFLNRTSQLL